MTPRQAHRVLSEAREGEPVTESVITWCLYVTGDRSMPAYRPRAIDAIEARFTAEAWRRDAARLLCLLAPT